MKTLRDMRDRRDILARLERLQPNAAAGWGTMTAPQMICHLSDSFRAALGEKQTSPSNNLFKGWVMKPAALWVPVAWPHGIATRPEIDQRIGGTRPAEFEADMKQLRIRFDRFCNWDGEYAPHAMFGQMTRRERTRHAYLHMDHHLRQFGV
jgi:hypothetical protein